VPKRIQRSCSGSPFPSRNRFSTGQRQPAYRGPGQLTSKAGERELKTASPSAPSWLQPLSPPAFVYSGGRVRQNLRQPLPEAFIELAGQSRPSVICAHGCVDSPLSSPGLLQPGDRVVTSLAMLFPLVAVPAALAAPPRRFFLGQIERNTTDGVADAAAPNKISNSAIRNVAPLFLAHFQPWRGMPYSSVAALAGSECGGYPAAAEA